MPGVLNVTGAGSAAVLPLGVPPGKLQEKVRGRVPSGPGPGPAPVLPLGAPPGKLQEKGGGRFPSGSLPVPAKSTLWPATIVTGPAGAVIVPSGGWFGGAVAGVIRLARGGTG